MGPGKMNIKIRNGAVFVDDTIYYWDEEIEKFTLKKTNYPSGGPTCISQSRSKSTVLEHTRISYEDAITARIFGQI